MGVFDDGVAAREDLRAGGRRGCQRFGCGLTVDRGAAEGRVVVGVAAEDAVGVVDAVVEADAVAVLVDDVAVGAREILDARDRVALPCWASGNSA